MLKMYSIEPVRVHKRTNIELPKGSDGLFLYSQQWFADQHRASYNDNVLITTDGSYVRTSEGYIRI